MATQNLRDIGALSEERDSVLEPKAADLALKTCREGVVSQASRSVSEPDRADDHKLHVVVGREFGQLPDAVSWPFQLVS